MEGTGTGLDVQFLQVWVGSTGRQRLGAWLCAKGPGLYLLQGLREFPKSIQNLWRHLFKMQRSLIEISAKFHAVKLASFLFIVLQGIWCLALRCTRTSLWPWGRLNLWLYMKWNETNPWSKPWLDSQILAAAAQQDVHCLRQAKENLKDDKDCTDLLTSLQHFEIQMVVFKSDAANFVMLVNWTGGFDSSRCQIQWHCFAVRLCKASRWPWGGQVASCVLFVPVLSYHLQICVLAWQQLYPDIT